MTQSFTNTAHAALTAARQEAQRLGHASIATEHLLLGIFEAGGMATRLLAALGFDADEVRDLIEPVKKTNTRKAAAVALSQSDSVGRMISHAQEEASVRGQDRVGTEHLLLGLLKEPDCAAIRLLQSLGIDIELLNTGLSRRLNASRIE